MISVNFPACLRGVAISVVFALVAAPWAQTVDNKPDVKAQVLSRVNRNLLDRAYVPGIDFKQWSDFAAAEKTKLDDAKNDDEFAFALNEALRKFGASHIYVMPPRVAETKRSGTMVGIGITQQPVSDGVLIVRVVPGAPASVAGLVPGDTIIAVDGKKVEGTRGIAGEEETNVTLTIRHADGKKKDYVLTRKRFSTIREEEFSEVAKDTAKITISTFEWTYNGDKVEQYITKALPYKNLVIDLRDNPGGVVQNVRHLLGLLIPRRSIVGTFVTRSMVDSFVKDTGGKPNEVAKIAAWSRSRADWANQQIRPVASTDAPLYTGNLVVLVNGGSGSGAEIAAAALHELRAASVVGQKSAGAVLVSTMVNATNNFTMMVPVMDYVTASGKRLEGAGVVPDVEAQDEKIRLPSTPDHSVETALLLLNRVRLREERGLGNAR